MGWLCYSNAMPAQDYLHSVRAGGKTLFAHAITRRDRPGLACHWLYVWLVRAWPQLLRSYRSHSSAMPLQNVADC